MNSNHLCLRHAEVMVRSLFVTQRLVIDTNYQGVRPIRCQYRHPLDTSVECENVASVSCTVLAKREPYLDEQYLDDIVPVPPKKTSQVTL